MVRWIVVAVLVATGCGRFHFAAGNDGASPGGDGGLPTCNSITRIADDFQDGVVDDNLWGGTYTNPGTTITEAGGDTIITPASNGGNAYAGLVTYQYYDLREHRISAEVTKVANAGTNTGLSADYNSFNFLHVSVKNGNLQCSQMIQGAFMQLMSVPYDPALHRFWAIEEHAGQSSFETSPDGVTFTTQFQMPDPFDMSLMRAALFAGTDASVATPGDARFASFNGVAQPGSGCPASSLVDRFDNGEIGHAWEPSFTDGCCAQSELGGALQLTTDGTLGYVSRRSSAGYDLRGDRIIMQVVGPANGTAFYSNLIARRDAMNSLELQAKAAQFNARAIVAGTLTVAMLPRSTLGSYLRIREASGQIYYEVSADKVMWTLVRQIATPFPVDDLTISLQAGIAVTPTGTADTWTFSEYGVD